MTLDMFNLPLWLSGTLFLLFIASGIIIGWYWKRMATI